MLYSVIETKETYVCGFIPLGLVRHFPARMRTYTWQLKVVGRDSGTIESGIDPIEIDVTHTDLNKCRNKEERLYNEISDMIRSVVNFSRSCSSTKQKIDTGERWFTAPKL